VLPLPLLQLDVPAPTLMMPALLPSPLMALLVLLPL
jgi:hypothetical protein